MKKSRDELRDIVRNMSASQKAGQLFLLAYPGKNPTIIRPLMEQYGICGCYISQDNAERFDEAEAVAAELQSMSLTFHGIPLILGVDQEGAWGVLVPESHPGPGNMALSAIEDRSKIAQMYGIIGSEMMSVGYNTLLGPCADVNSDPHSPIIGTRSFGEFTDEVAASVVSALAGARGTGILTCLKHFPGHGATSIDTHRELPLVHKSYDELRSSDLIPFKAGIDAGAELVMTSHIRFPKIDGDNPATLSKKILHDILRQDLGFQGLVISDSMNMGAIRKTYDPAESTLLAIQAGVDIVMLSEEHYDFEGGDYLQKQIDSIELVKKAIESELLDPAMIEEKIVRILDYKFNRMNIRTPRISEHAYARNAETTLAIASAAVKVLQKNFWPLPADGNIVCINATPSESYSNVMNSRGIGPNQAESAYDGFVRQLQKTHRIECRSHSQAMESIESLAASDVLVVVTEDYPLPGEDFVKDAQQALVKVLCDRYPEKVIVVGLRSPYELASYPLDMTYVCAFSSRTCSAQAAATVLSEGKECTVSDKSPVSTRF